MAVFTAEEIKKAQDLANLLVTLEKVGLGEVDFMKTFISTVNGLEVPDENPESELADSIAEVSELLNKKLTYSKNSMDIMNQAYGNTASFLNQYRIDKKNIESIERVLDILKDEENKKQSIITVEEHLKEAKNSEEVEPPKKLHSNIDGYIERIVRSVKPNEEDATYSIYIRNEESSTTHIYRNLKSSFVIKGQNIKFDDKLGEIGEFFHYEVYWD